MPTRRDGSKKKDERDVLEQLELIHNWDVDLQPLKKIRLTLPFFFFLYTEAFTPCTALNK